MHSVHRAFESIKKKEAVRVAASFCFIHREAPYGLYTVEKLRAGIVE